MCAASFLGGPQPQQTWGSQDNPQTGAVGTAGQVAPERRVGEGGQEHLRL